MSVSEWLIMTACVLLFVIAVQVGLVWRILSSFAGIANRIRDIGLEAYQIRSRIDILLTHIRLWTNNENSSGVKRETNMDHLKSIKSSKEKAKILNNAPWCPSANGDICVDPGGGWKACEKCRERWLDAPYEEEKWCTDD